MTLPRLDAVLPGVAVGSAAAGAALVLGLAFRALAAHLRRKGMRVAYTRKVFHFGIFTGAGVVHLAAGLPATNVYGAVVAAVVLVAVFRGRRDPLYGALARDKDHPRETLFIVVPLITTAVGGLAAGVLAGPWASVGYLVGGWGDAIGEPVGARWGRHPYRVPSLMGVPATRTLEGSAAVFAVGALAALVALTGLGVGVGRALVPALLIAAASAAVEAISNHGTDNLTVQLTAALMALALLG